MDLIFYLMFKYPVSDLYFGFLHYIYECIHVACICKEREREIEVGSLTLRRVVDFETER